MVLLTDTFETFLIDWDGTLANTIQMWQQVLLETYEEFDVHPSTEGFMEASFGRWNAPLDYGIEDLETFNRKLFFKAQHWLPEAELFDGAADVLKQLNSLGKRLVLITSSTRSVIEPALQHNKLNGVFDHVITADDVTHHKPDPVAVIHALELTDSSPEQAVMVGDSSNDIRAAHAADVAALLVYPQEHRSYFSQEYIDSLGADLVLDSIKELLSASLRG